MTNYGLPLRFKAVDVKTGEIKPPIEWKECVCAVDHGGAEIAQYIAEHHGCKFYQSTGHHDANGQEIFFGDVLIGDCEKDMYNVQINSRGEIYLNARNPLDPCPRRSILEADSMDLVGNIHTPKETLEKRAMEVLND